MANIGRWIRSLMLPRITSVQVRVWEDDKEIRNFDTYPESKLVPLMGSINQLWATPENSTIWFESKLREKKGFFRKGTPNTTLHVKCYRIPENFRKSKEKTEIPGKYMKKFLDKKHRIYPDQIGYTPWPDRVAVKFILLE